MDQEVAESGPPHPEALKIAAQAAGLRPDQVARALAAYREVVASLEVEPDWRAQMHLSGRGFGCHTYVAEGTKVMLHIETWKGGQERSYHLGKSRFGHYAEARAAELTAEVRPKPYPI